VNSFAVSLDGYAAGPHQSLEAPLGVRGLELFEWFFSTRTWKQMHGYEGGIHAAFEHAKDAAKDKDVSAAVLEPFSNIFAPG
jgi:hypothetical protein